MEGPGEPIRYIDRGREYYLALGYDNPYRWAHYEDVPFTPLTKPLKDCQVGLITTAVEFQPDAGDQSPGAPMNSRAQFGQVYSQSTETVPDMRVVHLGYDRPQGRVEDVNGFFPLARMKEFEAAGRLGRIAPRFHGVPYNRSQRVTLERDAPEVLRRCQEDRIDVAVLVAI